MFIGIKDKDSDTENDIQTKLYPNYQDWCEKDGIKEISVQRFGRSLDDLCQLLKLPIKREEKDQYGRKFTGLAIRNISHIHMVTPITHTNLNDGNFRSTDEDIPPASTVTDSSDDSDGDNCSVENEFDSDDVELF